uniref:Uncharacterized protein n=1 Tax=Meloidogyne enterolobii TaxID=390850 RepID=A0A6V7WK02_MELEN|nr:unnamed protein product [Meloidogyne enterolobii]
MFVHIDRNPNKLDYKSHHDLIATALIAKGAKTKEIEYKLNKMNHEKAYKILSDYGKHCKQKINDIEEEVKVKALVCFKIFQFYLIQIFLHTHPFSFLSLSSTPGSCVKMPNSHGFLPTKYREARSIL